MSMNELRQQHPKIYEQLLWDHAVPFVRDLRNEYYLSLMDLHQVFKLTDFSSTPQLRASLMKDIDRLQTAERILIKATTKTKINARAVGNYDPDKDLQKVLAGEIKPSFGNRTYDQMESAAKEKKCAVKYRTIPLEKYHPSRSLDRFPHNAFFKGPNVVIGYLETDHKELKPIFDKMSGKEALGDKIANAQSRHQSTDPSNHQKIQHEPSR